MTQNIAKQAQIDFGKVSVGLSRHISNSPKPFSPLPLVYYDSYPAPVDIQLTANQV